MENFIIVVTLALATPLGMLLGYAARKIMTTNKINSAEARAENFLVDAKTKAKDILLETKDRALKITEEIKKEEILRRNNLDALQKRLERRESFFDQKILDLEDRQRSISEKTKQLESLKKRVLEIKDAQQKKLEDISHLNPEEAKQSLLDIIEKRSQEDLVRRMKRLEETNSDMVEEKARDLLSLVMMRNASAHTAETTTTSVQLPNDEMKGRIIGRDGRNIKTLEKMTGVEIIVDDTPSVITVSGFSMIRRHLAKRVIDKLIEDGRIQPARIETIVEEEKKDIANEIRKAGEATALEAGVTGLHPKLIQLLGRLKYRTSYGQNQLRHSIEVSQLSVMIASELKANVGIVRIGGLLHDIGKAVDQEIQGSHPEIGQDIMVKFGLPKEISYLSVAHHEDHPATLEGIIVKIADAISGARPGARKDTLEQYIQRLGELEDIAKAFDGVENAYAIQAGRELRVFVEPHRIDDLAAEKLAREIAGRIEEELNYPGEIRVTVIREKRITDYAR